MAVRTSTQSGNFNSTATWGGNAVPVDADQFIVSAGHVVTINDDRRVTNGYHDSTIFGKLYITGTGKLKMNGNLTVDMPTGATQHFAEGVALSGAYFRMDNGARLEIKGDNAAQHQLTCTAEPYVWIEIDGNTPNSRTTISANTTVGSSSVSVVSSTGFASGDWVSLFVEAEDIDDWEIQGRQRSEGAIVHDISGNTVYLRWFVSPSATIQSVNGSTAIVDNSKVFRVGQQVIFGTGANRNVRTISSINNTENRITFTSSISGSVIGQKIYRSNIEKYHASGDTFQKVATPLTADANSGQAVITVASTAGMTVGKRIHIEANNPADTLYDYECLYTISSISGNNITLTGNLANKRIAGAWVSIWDRDTFVGSTDVGTSTQRPFIYVIGWTSATGHQRRIRIRNTLLEGLGSNSSNSTWFRGITLSICSYENNSYGGYASSFEGNCWQPNNRDNNATITAYYWHQCVLRNNIAYNGTYNYWIYAANNHATFFGNISSRANYASTLIDGTYQPQLSVEYNHFSRSEDYGLMIQHRNDAGQSFRHNYITHHQNRPFYTLYQIKNGIFDNNYIDGYRYWPFISNRGGDVIFLNCYLGNSWDNTGGATSPVNGIFIADNDEKRPRRGGGDESKAVSINHNWEIDETVEWGGYAWRKWDRDESAWFVKRTIHSSVYAGWNEMVYVPAGVTVYLACNVKMSTGFSGTRPYFCAYKVGDQQEGAYTLNGTAGSKTSSDATNSRVVGFLEQVQYTTTALSGYDRQTLTIQPQKDDYYLAYAVFSSSSDGGNGSEGWYQKPYEVYMSETSNIKSKVFAGKINTKITTGNSTQSRKTRLGGRIG